MDRDWRRDYFRLAYANQGGVTDQILAAALDEGVCTEEKAPWFPSLSERCRWMEDRSGCVIEGLKTQKRRYDRQMRRWEKWQHDPEVRRVLGLFGKTRTERHADRLQEIFSDSEAYIPEGVQKAGVDVSSLLASSRDEFDFVQKVLIPKDCQERRVFLSGSVWKEDWSKVWIKRDRSVRTNEDGSVTTSVSTHGEKIYRSQYSNKERLGRLADWVFLSERSVGLGICASSALSLQKIRGDNPVAPERCHPHAIVANGLRWNPERSRCEVHVRNSWGSDSRLRGWVAVEPVLNSTIRISGILPGAASSRGR